MIWTVLGTIGIVAATVVIGFVADRRWGILPRKEQLDAPARPALPKHTAGEAPATAIRISSAQPTHQIEQLRKSQRCCRMVMESLADDEVQFDGHTLGILKFRCASCGTTRSIYVQRLVE